MYLAVCYNIVAGIYRIFSKWGNALNCPAEVYLYIWTSTHPLTIAFFLSSDGFFFSSASHFIVWLLERLLIQKDPSRHRGFESEWRHLVKSWWRHDRSCAGPTCVARLPPTWKADGAERAATNRQSNPLLLNADFKMLFKADSGATITDLEARRRRALWDASRQDELLRCLGRKNSNTVWLEWSRLRLIQL